MSQIKLGTWATGDCLQKADSKIYEDSLVDCTTELTLELNLLNILFLFLFNLITFSFHMTSCFHLGHAFVGQIHIN